MFRCDMNISIGIKKKVLTTFKAVVTPAFSLYWAIAITLHQELSVSQWCQKKIMGYLQFYGFDYLIAFVMIYIPLVCRAAATGARVGDKDATDPVQTVLPGREAEPPGQVHQGRRSE